MNVLDLNLDVTLGRRAGRLGHKLFYSEMSLQQKGWNVGVSGTSAAMASNVV